MIARWTENPEYLRLVDDDPAVPLTPSQARDRLEEHRRAAAGGLLAHIRDLGDDRLLGFVSLHHVHWPHAEATLSMGIGDRRDWARGFGTDALHLILRYAFYELGLFRISLTVIEYNKRALNLYQKVGFKEEGRQRQAIYRDGRRWDLVHMGMLSSEYSSPAE